MHALDSATNILDAAPAIAWNKHDGTERIETRVGGDGAPVRMGAGGGDPDLLESALVWTVGHDRFKFPVALPAAARAAAAVAGGFHVDDFRSPVARNVVSPPGRAPA